ncbi:hypothetical protein V1525DRAFT_391535 [Lipomyces kononenkoae]|uniref:Uncharacterized protein n=1 Tax=Lipomyces kononenkoae TaxID=34357 RepID=A0ACC3SRT3_LIPKO
MSIRGMKKAVVRAPHVLIGNKSPEDLTIIEWTKAINEAEDGLEEIIKNAKAFRDSWISILSAQVGISRHFITLYEPIPEEDPCKPVQETPKITMAAVIKYKEVLVEVQNAVLPMLDSIDRMVVQRCATMKGYIDTIKKALRKREHKKIDFDRHTNTVEKLQKKSTLSEKDQSHLDRSQKELDKATEDFRVHDQYIKDTLPKVIVQLSEFVAPLSTLLFEVQFGVIEITKEFLYPFAQAQGLLGLDKIVDDWSTQFIPIQHRCEEGLKTVRNGKAVKQPMALPESTPIDQKIMRALTVNKKSSRPKGTTKDGVYKNFTDVNRSPTLMSSVSSENGSEVGSETGRSTPASPRIASPAAYAPKRTFSYAGSTTSSMISEPLPRYQTPASVVAGTPLSSSISPDGSHEEMQEETLTDIKASDDEKGASRAHEVMTAAYTFVGMQDTDLSFSVGDKVIVYKKDDDDWWEGETMDGRRGEFPGNYVK